MGLPVTSNELRLTSYKQRVTTCCYASLGCGAEVHSSWEDCSAPRDNPPSVRQSGRHAGSELRPGTFSTYDSGATSYDSLLRLPWLWGRGPLQLGGLLGTQGQPLKCPAVRQACLNRAKARHLTSYELRVTTCCYASLGCGVGVCSSWEDCPPPRDNPPSVQQSGRHAGTELRPGTFSPRETYDFGV